jgi:WD40 repeat protein/serine/threonine protein kinase
METSFQSAESQPSSNADVNATAVDSGLDAVLGEYLAAVEQGRAPTVDEFIARHRIFEREIREFLSLRNGFERISASLRHAAGPLPRTFPMSFGRYELIGELGQGGMGVVYRARQPGLDREVALKTIKGGRLASAAAAQRFRVEAIAVSRLNHPGIVPVYDVGDVEGQAYFTMKLLKGGDLTRRVGTDGLEPADAARNCAQLADAVQHAHEHGILHRDLKPNNVLFDEDGRSYLSDFGVAKLLDTVHDLTQTGEYVGTPAYLAPEIARGDEGGATIAADVHGLGAILYFSLTGTPPFDGPSPVAVLDSVRRNDPPALRTRKPRIPTDLATICHRCLEKEPTRRYASARDLAKDLRRWLEGRPIRARPNGRVERFVKWIRREPTQALLAACFVTFIASAIGGTIWHSRRLSVELDVSDRLRKEGLVREAELRKQVYVADMELAKRAFDHGQLGELSRLLDRQLPSGDLPDVRGWEWRHLDRARHQKPLATWQAHSVGILSADVSPDESLFATCDRDGVVRIWDAAANQQRLEVKRESEATAVRFSRDGKTLATCGSGGFLELWNVADGRQTARWQCHDGTVAALEYSPDGRRILTSGRDGTAALWDATSHRLVRRVRSAAPVVNNVAWSRDGSRFALCGQGGVAEVWSGDGRRQFQLQGPGDETNLFVCFAPDDRTLLAVGYGEGVLRWNLETGQPLATIPNGSAYAVAFDGPRRFFVAAGYSQIAAFESDAGMRAPRFVQALAVDESTKRALVLAPVSRRLWTVGEDGKASVWSLADALVPQCSEFAGRALAVSPDGNLTARERDGAIEIVDFGGLKNTLTGASATVADACFSPDGRSLAVGRGDGLLESWSVETGRSIFRRRESTGVRRVAFSADGTTVAALNEDYRLSIRRASDGELLKQHGATSFAIAPDGKFLVVGFGDPCRILILDAATLQDVREMTPAYYVDRFTFSPDGKLLVALLHNGTLEFWDVATGECTARHGRLWTTDYGQPSFSPDGRTFATVAPNGPLKLWNVETRKELLTLRAVCEGENPVVQFTPDGDLVLLERPTQSSGRLYRWKSAD